MEFQKLNMKIEIDLELDGEFEDLIKRVETKLYKEVSGGKVTLFLETDIDLVHIREDVLRLKAESNYINIIYKMFRYPYQAIEFIKDIEDAEKYTKRKCELQEKLFGIKYTKEQYLHLVAETFQQIRFSKYTFEMAMDEVGRRTQRKRYGIG